VLRGKHLQRERPHLFGGIVYGMRRGQPTLLQRIELQRRGRLWGERNLYLRSQLRGQMRWRRRMRRHLSQYLRITPDLRRRGNRERVWLHHQLHR